VTVPSSLTFISEHETTSQYPLATCFRHNGDLLVGTSNGLYVLRRGGNRLNPCSTNVKTVTSVVEHHQNVIILYREGNISKVDMCLDGDITKKKEIFQFDRTGNFAAVMAVSDRYVVVRNPDTKELVIYDYASQQTNKNSCYLLGLQFLPDGCLLGVVGGKLQKYKIENGQLVELWTCYDLKGGYSLCTDSNGLIYVTARSRKKMYVVSSQGAATNFTF